MSKKSKPRQDLARRGRRGLLPSKSRGNAGRKGLLPPSKRVGANLDLAATLEQRLSTAVETLVKVTPAATMLTLLGERTDVDSLIGFVSQNSVAIASAALVEDPLRAAKSRAAAKMADLMAAEGGPWGVEQVAKHLQITRAGVDKRRRSRTLIGVTDGARAAKYPSWQFTTTGTLAGLEDVLRRMRVSDPWMQMQFFLLPDVDLGESPLHALREKRMNEVIAAAERYGAEGPDA